MSLIVSIAWIEPMMPGRTPSTPPRSEEHTSELQSRSDLVCRLLLEKKKKQHKAVALAYKKIPALPSNNIAQYTTTTMRQHPNTSTCEHSHIFQQPTYITYDYSAAHD